MPLLQRLYPFRQRSMSRIIARHGSQANLGANEFSPICIPLLVQPVGIDQAGRIIVGLFQYRLEKIRLGLTVDHTIILTDPQNAELKSGAVELGYHSFFPLW